MNLYINARNKMLFTILGRHEELCVLRVDTAVLDLPGVIVTDQNAASQYARFEPAPQGLAIVDRDLVFAERWTHPDDQIEEWKHGSAMCAEVLVPDCVPPRFIGGCYASNTRSCENVPANDLDLSATINPHLFFM